MEGVQLKTISGIKFDLLWPIYRNSLVPRGQLPLPKEELPQPRSTKPSRARTPLPPTPKPAAPILPRTASPLPGRVGSPIPPRTGSPITRRRQIGTVPDPRPSTTAHEREVPYDQERGIKAVPNPYVLHEEEHADGQEINTAPYNTTPYATAPLNERRTTQYPSPQGTTSYERCYPSDIDNCLKSEQPQGVSHKPLNRHPGLTECSSKQSIQSYPQYNPNRNSTLTEYMTKMSATDAIKYTEKNQVDSPNIAYISKGDPGRKLGMKKAVSAESSNPGKHKYLSTVIYLVLCLMSEMALFGWTL